MDLHTTLDHPEPSLRERIARRLLMLERLLMGLAFIGCGIAGAMNMVPQGAGDPGAVVLGGALLKMGFLFPLLKGTEVLLELYLASVGRKA